MKRILLPGVLGSALLLGACDGGGGGGGGPTEPEPNPEEIAVGQLLPFNAQADDACANPVPRTGRVVAITQRAVVVADTANPAGGFTDAEYGALGAAFDQQVYPLDTRNFGEPTDVDGNGRVILFFTSAVNDLTKPGEDSFVGGFFFGRDLFPTRSRTVEGRAVEGCAGSNFAEMFYLRVPDPNKTNFSRDEVRRDAVGTLAHEFQHLINQGRRLYRNSGAEPFEEVWLNEGLSHIAEELLFYQESGLAPRQNLDLERIRSSEAIVTAFNSYASSNFGRLIAYLRDPDAASLIGKDELPTRGASWAFLRYAADRKGGSDQQLWLDLVNSKTTGIANLQTALGASPIAWMQDWTVSVYTDDAVATAAAFVQPSWNFRSIMPAFSSTNNRYPLQTVPLGNGTANRLTLQAGGAAFLRFGVAPLGRAEIRTTSGSATLPGACATDLDLRVGEVVQVEPNAVGQLCVAGGATGAEFTLVPFYASEVSEATLAVEVTGSGVSPVSGLPNPARIPSAEALFNSATSSGELRADERFERRLREMEIRQLAPRAGGGMAPLRSASTQSSATTPAVKLSLVRTR